MSYARFAPDSDVYVYESSRGGIECQRCRFMQPTDAIASGPRNNAVMVDEDEMIAHLAKHRKAGHRVPETPVTAMAGGPRERKREPFLSGTVGRA